MGITFQVRAQHGVGCACVWGLWGAVGEQIIRLQSKGSCIFRNKGKRDRSVRIEKIVESFTNHPEDAVEIRGNERPEYMHE